MYKQGIKIALSHEIIVLEKGKTKDPRYDLKVKRVEMQQKDEIKRKQVSLSPKDLVSLKDYKIVKAINYEGK